ncbi:MULTISPECIES: NAD-dependent epimerase/dehydratase family protein [unclassified Crossiella]|uniref:NAD-dependent epimerase/dehydratase family protein n=1 Tax=unclassified Crossiella TaxID=2620835 RepID=UPI001FFFCA89|nr:MULTISPECIES: NAD-dependent epimerase/dehydratase family protein [unclassified Crossiella]MCK2240522.1 NAD-dependent epimerase/dehydratase family protein [Crossiella sp. S99.2]MCK2253027.1 NAD-dependent epimerase/dehydratase family protein [Crossiella sp. S99.1]
MPRVLLLGATGFIGRHVLHRLIRRGDLEVVTAARGALPSSPWHVRIDLTAEGSGAIGGLLAQTAPDVVVNCAGHLGGDPAELAAANIDLPDTLVRAALCGPERVRLVHLGSAAEYGRVVTGEPVTEQTPTRPVGVYGITKLAASRLVCLARVAGLDAVVLRVFNPIGPGSPPGNVAGALAKELLRAQAEGDEVRLGPLSAVRDFIDVRDVAEAVHAAAFAPVIDEPVLNVGSGEGIAVGELAKALTGIAGYTGPIGQADTGSARSAAVPWQQAEISAIGKALDWRPAIDLATSLSDLWQEAQCRT